MILYLALASPEFAAVLLICDHGSFFPAVLYFFLILRRIFIFTCFIRLVKTRVVFFYICTQYFANYMLYADSNDMFEHVSWAWVARIRPPTFLFFTRAGRDARRASPAKTLKGFDGRMG